MSKDQFLSLDDIIGIDDFVYEVVEIPEWPKNGKPGQLMVRNATSLERDKWERSVQGLDDGDNRRRKQTQASKEPKTASRAMLIAMCTVNPVTKERLFRDSTSVLQLARKNSAPISRLFNKIIELSDVTEDDLKEMELEFEENPTLLSATE